MLTDGGFSGSLAAEDKEPRATEEFGALSVEVNEAAFEQFWAELCLVFGSRQAKVKVAEAKLCLHN